VAGKAVTYVGEQWGEVTHGEAKPIGKRWGGALTGFTVGRGTKAAESSLVLGKRNRTKGGRERCPMVVARGRGGIVKKIFV
jgi:hypothetical protein